MWLKGKSILLTNYTIANYAGSEINCLYLAKAFQQLGAHVELATLNYAFPVREEFEKSKIKVKNVFFDALERNYYDVIWAQHALVLDYILFELGVQADKIVYSCLSPFEPFEAPPQYVNHLSLCLANSVETSNQLLKENVNGERLRVFPNFVPMEFYQDASLVHIDGLKKVALVSNHIPGELLQTVSQLKNAGISIEIFGQGYRRELVTSELLSEYSAVITIGKTVQYAMALGIPVYCYDIHGGPGWLSEEILDKAAALNFSGRGFSKKSSAEIAAEILEGHMAACECAGVFRQYIKDNCILEDNLYSVFTSIEKENDVDIAYIKSKFWNTLRWNKAMVQLYRYNLFREMKIVELETKDKMLELEGETKIKTLEMELEQKEATTRYLLDLLELKNQQLDHINSSKAWKCILLYRRVRDGIFRRVRKLFKKIFSVFKRSKETTPALEEAKAVVQGAPLVTVVIPVYDRTDVLIESIESILHQTYPNIEIIAVCDGSPKETLEIIQSYEMEGKIRAFYYPDNSGNAVRGRNKAIREARGVYFAFQDSDDVADPDRIKKSVEYIEKYNADVVYGGWRALVDGSREIDIKNGQLVLSPDCDYEMLKEACVPCQSTVMARTEVLRKVGGLKTNMRYREDHELWLRIAYQGYKFKSISDVLTNLRLHKGNLELTFKENDGKWYELMLEEHKKITPMKPKVAYLIPGCGISGGIAVICQHLNRLRERGYDVLMISETPETKITWFPNQKVEIVTMDKAPDNIDILVATGWTTAHSAVNIPAKKKFYFVQSDETRFNPEGSYSYQKALETYSMDYQFITEAKWIQKWLLDKFGKHACYVPNGIDPSLMYCTEERPNPLDRKVRVLLEGPIDVPFKAMEDAFNAIDGLDCEVWCISSAGVPKPEWHCDKFFSKVSMERMKYIYSSCDILLKMSRVEGFFGPPMEMMACGGTCVVGKVTGYDEYIVDGYNALTVELGDVQGAHNAVKRLIEDSELRNTLAQNGLKTAAEWRWETSIDTLEEIFTAAVTN